MPPCTFSVNADNEIQRYCSYWLLLCEEYCRVVYFILLTQNTQIKSNKKSSKLLVFLSVSSFFMMYYLLQGVDGSLRRIPVCFMKAVPLLSQFNDKQASSHILLPTMAMNRNYPGNIGGCVYTRCKATTSDCMGLVLITSSTPAGCVNTPIKLCPPSYRNNTEITGCDKRSRAV